MDWSGVLPAVTTPFTPKLEIDEEFFARHLAWLSQNGIEGVVLLGSLGEGATLDFQEKCRLLELGRSTMAPPRRVIAAISGLRTSEAVGLAKASARIGCDGVMVLPPYVYRGDWEETRSHVESVIQATPLPAMLYNNPAAYGIDFSVDHVDELTRRNPNLEAVKDSTGQSERIGELTRRFGPRIQVSVGIDEVVRPGVLAGARGWVAGLANAMPRESVDLFAACNEEAPTKSATTFEWFLPLLRYDSDVKFVQRIKFVSEELGIGTSRVRPPRYALNPAEQSELRTVLGQVRAQWPAHVVHSSPLLNA